MKVVYITPDRALADSLKRQLAQLSPGTALEIRGRVADARDLLASGALGAVLTDTLLPDEDAPELLAAIRQHALPFVIIVAPAAGVRGGFHWALRAGADDYVWSYAPGTFQSIGPPRFASDVAASLGAIERRRTDSLAAEARLCTVYVGTDERVRELLGTAPGIELKSGDGLGSDVAVVDASPYDAIHSVRALRDVSPALPVVLLCAAELPDPEDIAKMLGIERVLVKSGAWLEQVLPALRAAVKARPAAALDVLAAPVLSHRSVLAQEVLEGVQLHAVPTHSGVGVTASATGNRPMSSVGDARPRETAPLAAASAALDARPDAFHEEPRRLLLDEQARRAAMQRQLDDARSREAELTSALASEREASSATLREAVASHQETLTRERSDREDLAQRLAEAQGELLKRLPLAEVIGLTSTARRKGRLADFAVSVATELVSLFGNVAASAERAATVAPAGSGPRLHADETRRTAARARDVVNHLLLFSQSQAQPAEPVDLAQVMRDLQPTLQQILGGNVTLAMHVEPATAPVPLNHDPVSRVLLSAALLCREGLPIGGRVLFEVRHVDEVPTWAPSQPQSETLPFVRVTATVHGHALKPVAVTPSLVELLQECDGHAEVFATDEPASGLHIYLPRAVSQT